MPADGTALDHLFDTAGLDPAARSDLQERMAEPTRHYHTAAHLEDLWTWHRRFCRSAGFDSPSQARLVACAIAYHDAVFVTGARDNEAMSAAVWRQAAPATMPPADVDWVADTILCTADHLGDPPPSTLATDAAIPKLRHWVLDLDLMPLAETPDRFAENSARLNAEWPAAGAEAAARSQRAFLRRIETAPRIYCTPFLHDAFEPIARANIAAALAATAEDSVSKDRPQSPGSSV